MTSESGSTPPGYFWWSQSFDLAPDARLAVGAPALAWSELGARVLQAAGVDLIEQATAKSTYLEAVQQAMTGLVRRSLSAPRARKKVRGPRRRPLTSRNRF